MLDLATPPPAAPPPVARRPVRAARRRAPEPRGRRWSREEITGKLRAWAERHGGPPTMRDWEPSRARRTGQDWRARRFEAGDWPSAKVVQTEFGTFNAAVRAAGLTPNPSPGPGKRHLTGPDQVIAAIIEWTRRYGEPPSQTDWDVTRAARLGQRWRIERYRSDDWPSLNTVVRHFGSLGNAVCAAGLTGRQRGVHGAPTLAARSANLVAVAQARAAGYRQVDGRALVRHVEAVARARRELGQPHLRAALIDLAAAALSWAEALD